MQQLIEIQSDSKWISQHVSSEIEYNPALKEYIYRWLTEQNLDLNRIKDIYQTAIINFLVFQCGFIIIQKGKKKRILAESFKKQSFNHDLSDINDLEQRAHAQGFGIYKINQKNKAVFTQTINDNLETLISSEHL